MTILTKQPLSLFHFDTDLLDTSGKVWTTTNSPVVSAGQSVFGGSSCKFTNSYFQYANTLIDTSKDFTVSYREYLTSLNSSGAFALSTNANSTQGILLGFNGTTFYASTSGGGWEIAYTMATSAEVLNQWVHWELTYVASSKTLRLFKDGILKNTWTLANHFPMVNNNWIGFWGGVARNGYMDEVLIMQECLHTTNFTPPTSAYEVSLPYWLAKTKDNLDLNAKVLLHFNGNFNDVKGTSWVNTNEYPTSPTYSTGIAKFGSSVNFVNEGAWKSSYKSNFMLDTHQDFTINWWEYCKGGGDGGGAFILNRGSTSGDALRMYYVPTNNQYYLISANNANSPLIWNVISDITSILNKWVHWEICFKASTMTIYVFKDGVQVFTKVLADYIANIPNTDTSQNSKIGYLLNGYLDEFYITQECLHTTNFTPPTAPYDIGTPMSYWSYKTNSWVDVGLPTTDADIATLFVNQGTNTCPTQQQLELLGTGVNRPNRCCYQPVVATQPTININAVPTGKTVKPEELLPISSIEGIDSVSVANTISTGINDETGKIWTKVGTAQLSNTQSKFGGSSLYLDGSSYVSTIVDSNFNLGLSDFTIEFFYKSNATNTNYQPIICQRNSNVNGAWSLSPFGAGGNSLNLYYHYNNPINIGFSSGVNVQTGEWFHIALTRQGNVIDIYVNGIKVITGNLPTDYVFGNVGHNLRLGYDPVNNAYNVMYIDELRISKGIAKYTSNFTPPTAPYIKDVGTISLLHFDSSVAKLKLAVTLDLVTYYKFNGSAWEVIDINTNQDNMMDIATVTSINRSQWDLLTNGTASGIAFAYYLDLSGTGDTVKIDKTSLVVDMKGEWNSAIKGTDFRYGYPANDLLKVTLLTTGNYKINYVGG